MKMTPEQKAFFEYGAAWETTVVIHTFIRSLLKDKGYQLSPELLHHYRDEKSHYGAVLREAWQKRAECRAWNPPEGRTCRKCENGYNYHRSSPCWKCLRNAAAEHYQFLFLQDNWEPRKEASND